ncbi:hypothetical protein GW17_00003447, partial [Ensete ventricosum]
WRKGSPRARSESGAPSSPSSMEASPACSLPASSSPSIWSSYGAGLRYPLSDLMCCLLFGVLIRWFDGILCGLQVRIQLGQGSAVEATKNMLANEGFGSFYKVRVVSNSMEIDWLLPCIRLSACSLPFDYVKTQIQKMPRESKYPTLKSGGLLKFYTGFPVYCVRIAPHIMVRPHCLE